MRIDAVGPRTWLLATVALWAVCVWALAALGLGGRVPRLAEDPALLQPLPQGGEVAGERLAPLAEYADIVQRPLFASDRQHRPFFIELQAEKNEPANDFDVVLTSILITPGLEMAIVQPTHGGEAVAFKAGGSAPRMQGWTLVSVEPRSAVFSGPNGERTLQLRVFDGVGGQPPTQRAAAVDKEVPEADAAGMNGRRPGRRMMPTVADEGVPARSAEAMDALEEATPASQAESIRSRIEARRARLREELSQQQNP